MGGQRVLQEQVAMIPKRFQDVTYDDVVALVDSEVPEDRTLDYKQEMPEPGSGGNREFVRDVVAFANSAGGDIIFGVSEQKDAEGKSTRLPDAIVGLRDFNADTAINRLEQAVLNGARPRVPGLGFRTLKGPDGTELLVVRVPRTWTGPHMVGLQDDRFYARDNGGRHLMDWQELRDSFLVSGELSQRLRRWRDQRVESILADQAPFPVRPGPMSILHIVPLAAFAGIEATDITPLVAEPAMWGKITTHATEYHYNVDGFVKARGEPREGRPGWSRYVQYWRDGTIEDVETTRLEGGVYASQAVEGGLLRDTAEHAELLADLGVQPPFAVILTLAGVRGFVLPPQETFLSPAVPLDRDIVTMPERLLGQDGEPIDQDAIDRVFKPAFDIIWNGFGRPMDPLYRGQTWTGHRRDMWG